MPLQNTGQIEIEVRETNPNNPNFGQIRWVPGGQDTTRCPVVAQVGSDAISDTVYRDDCGGLTSTGVLYTLPVNSYYASTKAQANALARAAFNAGALPYARANAVCQSKTVRIENVSTAAKIARVKVTRTDTQGQLIVEVMVQCQVDDGTGSIFARQVFVNVVIPDGQASATANASFGGAIIYSFEVANIVSTTPATYTF